MDMEIMNTAMKRQNYAETTEETAEQYYQADDTSA